MSTPPRQPHLTPARLDDAQRALYERITEGPRGQGPRAFPLTDADGALVGPFGGFLLAPEVGDALQQLGAAIRYRTTLSDRARELAILTVAAAQNSAFETAAHEAIGARLGLTDDDLAALRAGDAPTLTDPTEAAVVRLTRALLDGDVADDLWDECVPPLGVATVFELTTLVGYYSTLALQLRVLRTDVVP